MRIFIGPNEIAGLASALQAGFHEIGVEADCILSHNHPFDYDCLSRSGLVVRVWQKIGVFRQELARRSLVADRIAWTIWRSWSIIVWLWAITRFKNFIFIYGDTITNSVFELWMYKILRKKVIFVYCGSDARLPYINGTFLSRNDTNCYRVRERAQVIRRRISRNERFGICVNSPFTGHFHRRRYINWFHMGLPRNRIDVCPPNTLRGNESSVRVLHSPSSLSTKGTTKIIDAVNRLKNKGHKIELILMHGQANRKVLDEIIDCDFVIDQIYSDTPMAAFATEAAFCGRPAVVGGYASSQHLPSWPSPPSLYVHPDQIEAAIETLVTDEQMRLSLGERARHFALKWSARFVAERYLRLLTGTIPEDWWVEPDEVVYLHGCGLSEETCREAVNNLIDAFGPQGLELCDHPELEAAFLAFAKAVHVQ